MAIDIPKVLIDLAIILFSTKILGLVMRRLGLPQVVGMVIAGLLIGPAIWGCFGWWSPIRPEGAEKNFLNAFAEIGVVLILSRRDSKRTFRSSNVPDSSPRSWRSAALSCRLRAERFSRFRF
ncbi:MAG: cation:proton antiporter [Christensenellales bacterium]